jgi:hypothetical protein
MHIVRAGEFRRAVRWKLELGSAECEFVSFVSLYNPMGEKKKEEENTVGAEKDSTNSQTHTEADYDQMWRGRVRDFEEKGI